MAYAYNIVLMKELQTRFKLLFNRLNDAALKLELYISEQKTEYMNYDHGKTKTAGMLIHKSESIWIYESR